MNPRYVGVISKKFVGTPKLNKNQRWFRIDAVIVDGKKFTYFSNPPKENPSAEAIEDSYPRCAEGVKVEIEYVENPGTDKQGAAVVYNNIEDMAPVGGSLSDDDPIRKMTAPRVPDYLKPAPHPDEPRPDENNPAHPVVRPHYAEVIRQPVAAAPVGDEQAWRIARSVAIKECNTAATGGFLPALAEVWTSKSDTKIQALASVMARWIVTGE